MQSGSLQAAGREAGLIETPCKYCGSEPNGSLRHSCKKEYGYWMCGTHSWIIGEVRGQKCIDIVNDRLIHEMKGLLETAVEARDIRGQHICVGIRDGWVSLALTNEWFDAARKIVEELDAK